MEKLHKLLINKSLTISTAESCTGGLLGHYFTNIPNSSQYYMGGIIAYNKGVKQNILQVPNNIELVSESCVLYMNEGLKNIISSDIHISVTGYLGPDASRPELSGIVFYSILLLEIDHTFKLKIGDVDRQIAKEFIISNILNNLYKIIHNKFFLVEFLQ